MLPETQTKGPWTYFSDCHSGGGKKLPWGKILIQAPQAIATAIFMERFHRNPFNVTCDCCGEDYCCTEEKDLYQATAGERYCAFGRDEYEERPNKGDENRYANLEEYLLVYGAEVEDNNVLALFKENDWTLSPEQVALMSYERKNAYGYP